MRRDTFVLALLLSAVCVACSGCRVAPGKPTVGSEAARPDQVLDFQTLYKQNCAACHGQQGRNGAAVSLANPVYVAFARVDNIQRIIAAGVPGTQMPPFGRAAGGMLTDLQVQTLAHGIVDTWGRRDVVGESVLPGYKASLIGDAARGQQAFATFCARCHGSDGRGNKTNREGQIGPILDPSYLALVSDQSLRTAIVAGFLEEHMPDWRSDMTGAGARPMTDQEITDVVAWIASHRTATPGQPYQPHP